MPAQSSIVQVAPRAGVSIATASRVMSGSTYPVSEATRQKVLQAAQELNYTPNTLARNLRVQRSGLFAVMVGNNADPYYAEIMRGVEQGANEHGYLTVVCNTERNSDKELYYLRTLRDYRVDGIVFAGGAINEPGYAEQLAELVREITGYGAAIVTLAQHTLEVPSVQPDNFRGAYVMTERLLALGHRRIAFITGPVNQTVANIRLQGYMAALSAAGIAIDPALLLPGNFDRQGGEDAAVSIAQLAPEARPDAIFAANDETAFGLLFGLRQQHICVPEDLSVCGFGDLPMARLITPALTSVHIPLYELGRAGVLKLIAQLKHEEVSNVDVLPTTIVERETTAHALAEN